MPAAPASTASEARRLTGVRRAAERRRRSAACGANFSSSAITPSSARASRSSVSAPRGECVLGVDPAFDRERRAAEIGDREPLDFEPARIDPHVHVGLLRLDAGDRGAGDLERERAFARPIERGVAEHRLGECMHAVEVDVGRRERGVEPRRAVVVRPGIGHTPGDRHAIELELEPIDGDGILAEGDIAAEAQRTGGRGLLLAAFGQPGNERARIAAPRSWSIPRTARRSTSRQGAR